MKHYLLMLALAALNITTSMHAMPAQVIIIRHAEKPPEGHSLSTKGKERAAALAPFFLENKEVLTFGTPVAIYAMAAPKEDSSKRPIETVKPLAEALKLTTKDTYARDSYKKMVDEIKADTSYEGKMVLICWEHDLIPEISRAFSALQAPARWNGDAFDRLWTITFSKSGKATFQNVPQRLMFGDSTN